MVVIVAIVTVVVVVAFAVVFAAREVDVGDRLT